MLYRKAKPNVFSLSPSLSRTSCLQPFVFHPHHHTIDTFLLTAKSLPLVAPKTPVAENSRILQVSSADVTNAQHLEKPGAPRSSPLATQASVWTPPPFRKGFGLIQVSFVRFSMSFCLRSFALHSTVSYYTLDL